MKRAATIGLTMAVLTLNASLSMPAYAQGLLSDIVKDTLNTAAGVVGGVTGLATGAVSGAADIVTGTVDATGSVINASGNMIGRVVVGPTTTTTVVPGWTTVTPGSTTVVSGVAPSRVYTFGTAPTVFTATIDTRINDLRNAVVVAEQSGRLTATQAAGLRTDLDNITTRYAASRNNNSFAFDSAIVVARDLDTFNSKLATTLNVRPFRELVVVQNGSPRIFVSSAVIPGGTTVSTVQGSTVSTAPGSVISSSRSVITGTGNVVGNIASGLGNLIGGSVGNVITSAGNVIDGTIGTTGNVIAGTTRTVVTSAGNLVTGTVTSTGEIVDASGRVIGTVIPGALETVVSGTPESSRRVIVGTTTNVLGTNIDLRLADMRRVFADYSLSGRLTPVQVAELTSNLDRIQGVLASERVGGRTMTFDEAVALARDLDSVGARFGTFIGTNPWQPMVLMQAGNPRMTIITRDGVVSALPGSTTTLGSTVITAPITTGTTISTASIPSNPVTILPILDARRYELDRIIQNAVSNRTLTPVEAAQFNTELDRMVASIAGARTNPSFSMDQFVVMARTLDDFNNKLATTIRVTPLPALTVVGATGLPALASDQFANVVGLPSVEPTIWFNTFTTRRGEIESIIATGLAGGQITAQQAADLRAELTRISNLEAAARTSGITYISALPIAVNLDVLGNRVRTYVPTSTFVPLVSQNRITFVGGPSAPIDEVTLRRAEISASVDRELALGRLTAGEATRLKTELTVVEGRESRFRADGVLTYREATMLSSELSRIAARLNQLIANRRGSISAR